MGKAKKLRSRINKLRKESRTTIDLPHGSEVFRRYHVIMMSVYSVVVAVLLLNGYLLWQRWSTESSVVPMFVVQAIVVLALTVGTWKYGFQFFARYWIYIKRARWAAGDDLLTDPEEFELRFRQAIDASSKQYPRLWRYCEARVRTDNTLETDVKTELRIVRYNVTAIIGWLGIAIGLIGASIQYFIPTAPGIYLLAVGLIGGAITVSLSGPWRTVAKRTIILTPNE